MITSTKPFRSQRQSVTSGFTLVEILVVIAIIGILAGVLIPAIANALGRAKIAAQRLEINSLEQAIKAYEAKYGDYPPDGSNQAVLKRHLQKIFPRMAPSELVLVDLLTDDRSDDILGSFSGVAMDRSESLVFFLGGFSNDIQHPISGPGGPIELALGGTPTDITDYQYNATRDNAVFDFDLTRLTFARDPGTSQLMSTDETLLGIADAAHGGTDPFPAYRAIAGDNAPIVYFDSRTYGVIGQDTSGNNIYNGYLASSVGAVRPYKSGQVIKLPTGPTYGTEKAAFEAVAFENPSTFQIVSPGSDLFFGKLVSNSAGTLPVHFTVQGVPYIPNAAATNPSELIFPNAVASTGVGAKGFQDSDWGGGEKVNGHLDNVTNFTESTLGNGLE